MDRNLALEIVRVTEAAALSSARWMGKGDANEADKVANEATLRVINSITFSGEIAIGENDASSGLGRGMHVGCGDSPKIDIALDPLESKESVAFGRINAMAVIAMAPRGKFLRLPNIYMEKIAVGADAAGVIDIDLPIEENLKRVAEAKHYSMSDLTVVILDRKRHANLIDRVRNAGARIHLIPDGDVAAAIAVALPGTGIDMLVGTGKASASLLAASALNCMNGGFQGRFVVQSDSDRQELEEAGIDYQGIKQTTETLVGTNDTLFAATGITDGDLLQGVRYRPDGATTHSLVMRSVSKTRRFIVTEHFFEDKPQY